MNPTTTGHLQAFIALLSIVNPISAIPMFLAFTEDNPPCRPKVALLASASVGAVLVVSLLGGELVLEAFGITVPAFRIAGGIVVFLIGLSMLQSSQSRVKQTPEEHAEGMERANPAVIPLAIPLMSGPGAISTAIVYSHASSQAAQPLLHRAVLVGICVAVAGVTWLCLRLGSVIATRMSQTWMNIISRLMGLITAAVAVQMILTGLRDALPVLGGKV